MSCARCSAPAAEAHHPSGRIAGTYLDAGFTVALCLDCHRGEHAIRSALDLDKAAPASLVEVVEVALRRVAVTLGRFEGPAWVANLAEACRHWADLLAEACRDWADLLAEATVRLDIDRPGWRLAAGPEGGP